MTRPPLPSDAGLRNPRQAELKNLAEEAAHCERCPLYRDATQTVFGEGPVDALMMLVGEQPGDQEDRAGRPFVGPAGNVLNAALAEVGLDRKVTYVTNAVKHFKYEQRGKRRLHKHPDRAEVQACRWWLDGELALVQPKIVVALGTVAAHAILNKPIVLARTRGKVFTLPDGRSFLATMHPSAILRMPDESARHRAFADFVSDLQLAAKIAEGSKEEPEHPARLRRS
jgi:uracil-DNA glycosylase